MWLCDHIKLLISTIYASGVKIDVRYWLWFEDIEVCSDRPDPDFVNHMSWKTICKPWKNHGKMCKKGQGTSARILAKTWYQLQLSLQLRVRESSQSRKSQGQSLLNHTNHWQFIDIMTELIKRMCELMIYVSTDLTRSISWNRSANCEILVGHPQKWPESLKQQKLKDRTRKACKNSKLVTFGNTFAFCPPTWLLRHTNSLHGYRINAVVVLLRGPSCSLQQEKSCTFWCLPESSCRDASSQTCGG